MWLENNGQTEPWCTYSSHTVNNTNHSTGISELLRILFEEEVCPSQKQQVLLLTQKYGGGLAVTPQAVHKSFIV